MFNRLRAELLTAVLVVCCSVLLTQAVIRHVFTLPALQTMAAQQDATDIKLLASQFRQKVTSLETLLYDNAVWDEFYNAMLQQNTDWFSENYFLDGSYSRIGVSGWYFYDQHHDLLTGKSMTRTGDIMSPELFSMPVQPTILKILTNETGDGPGIWFLTVDGRPALAVTHAILRSDEQGPSAGTALLWTFIDHHFVESITPGIASDITLINRDSLASDLQVDAFYDSAPLPAETAESDRLMLGVKDYSGAPLFALSVARRPRPFNSSLFDSSLISGLLISAGVLFVFYLWVNKKLITPVSRLFRVLSYSTANKDYSKRTGLKGKNELNKLGQQLDELLQLICQQHHTLLSHNKVLEKLSLTDSLTGLGNRRAMDAYLESIVLLNRTTGQHFALIILDIDFFKNYNDHYGHAQGDEALSLIAELLATQVTSEHCHLFRYGGEEFVMVLEHTSMSQALIKAEQIIGTIREAQIVHEARHDKERVVTLSAGLAVKPADQRLNVNALFERADSSLYRAKRLGRNQVQVADNLLG